MAKQISPCVGGVVKKVKKVPVCVGGVIREAKKGVVGVNGVVREFYQNAMTIFELYDYLDDVVIPYVCSGEDSKGSCSWYRLERFTSYSEDTPNEITDAQNLSACKYQNGWYDHSGITPRGAFLFAYKQEGADIIAESIRELYSTIKLTNNDGAVTSFAIQSVTNLGKVSDIGFSITYGYRFIDSENDTGTDGYRSYDFSSSSRYKNTYVVHVATSGSQLRVSSGTNGRQRYAETITFE